VWYRWYVRHGRNRLSVTVSLYFLSCFLVWLTHGQSKCEEYHDRSFVIYFEYKGMKENRSNGYLQNTDNFQGGVSSALPSKRLFSARHIKDFPWSPTRGVNFNTEVLTFPVGDTCVVSQPKKRISVKLFYYTITPLTSQHYISQKSREVELF
jgi:hypothetical protein